MEKMLLISFFMTLMLLTGCKEKEIENTSINQIDVNINANYTDDELDLISDELFKRVIDNGGEYTNENGTVYTLKENNPFQTDEIDVSYTKNRNLVLATESDISIRFLNEFTGTLGNNRVIIELKNNSDKYAFVRKVIVSDDDGNKDEDSDYVNVVGVSGITHFYIKPNSIVYFLYTPKKVKFDIKNTSNINVKLDLYDYSSNDNNNTSKEEISIFSSDRDYLFDTMLLDNVEMEVNDVGNQFAIEFVNNNDEYLTSVEYEIVYYKDGKIVFVDDNTASAIDYAKQGESIYANETKAYTWNNDLSKNMIDFDSYEIIVFSSKAKATINFPVAKDLKAEILRVEDLESNPLFSNVYVKITNPTTNNIYFKNIYLIVKDSEKLISIQDEYEDITIPANSYMYCLCNLYKEEGINYDWDLKNGQLSIILNRKGENNIFDNQWEKDKDYLVTTNKNDNNELDITIKNLNNEKSIKNVKFIIAYFKNNNIVWVDEYGKLENVEGFVEISPNDELTFTKECEYFNNVNDHGKIDFDTFELLVEEVEWSM